MKSQRAGLILSQHLPTGAAWQAPTLALFLILLAFFIILGQMSQVQSKKFNAMQQSVHQALNGLPLNTQHNAASGGVDPKSAAAIHDIIAVAYNDITQLSKNNWDIVMVRQEKITNALDITLNAPAVLLDDVSPYPPDQRLSGILVSKMLQYQTPLFTWQLQIVASPLGDDTKKLNIAEGLSRFTRAVISRGLESTQVKIAFDKKIEQGTIQLYLTPQFKD